MPLISLLLIKMNNTVDVIPLTVMRFAILVPQAQKTSIQKISLMVAVKPKGAAGGSTTAMINQ